MMVFLKVEKRKLKGNGLWVFHSCFRYPSWFCRMLQVIIYEHTFGERVALQQLKKKKTWKFKKIFLGKGVFHIAVEHIVALTSYDIIIQHKYLFLKSLTIIDDATLFKRISDLFGEGSKFPSLHGVMNMSKLRKKLKKTPEIIFNRATKYVLGFLDADHFDPLQSVRTAPRWRPPDVGWAIQNVGMSTFI
ncbi:hypothetical protein ACB092_05G146600 [Castanea dentata]